jgi:Nucleoside-diphosphate-sugar epimerases
MKTILVTGGAGFIGSHLCHRLVAQGHDVVCLDNLFTGSKKNIEDLIGKSNFEFIRQDVIQTIDFKVDEIYNLACPASPPHYQYDPIATMKTSVLGAINVLELAKNTMLKCCRHRLPRCMVIPWCIRSRNPIGAMSILVEFAAVMTRASVRRKHCFLTIIDNIMFGLK